MTSTPSRRQQLGWVVLSAVLLALAFLPYDRLGGWLEAWLPVGLVLFAPAPYLAAMACGGGLRRTCLFASLWWMLGSVWLLGFDPELGPFAWFAAVAVGVGLTFTLGLLLAALRERRGAAFMLAWSPLVWTGWEVLRTWTPAGLPWFAPAHAFWKLPAFYQIAELTGYFGLSLPIAVVNAGFARVMLGDRGGRRELALGCGLLTGLLLFGLVRAPMIRLNEGTRVRVGLVQADISLQQKKRGPAEDLLDRHMALTQAAPAADLFVWPETAVPARLTAQPELLRKLSQGARARRSTLVVGAVEPLPGPYRLGAQGNAAFIFGPDGRLLDRNWKVHLVIFGEYLPGRELPLLRKLAPLTPQFTAGRRLHAVDTPVGRVGIPICFEGVFGADTRAMVRDGARALLLLTNDDQLCEIGARQHYQQSVFRAVETRRWIARCANGGISAFIEPTGAVTGATGWHQSTVHVGDVRLRDDPTFYVRYGNWFPVLCLLVTLAFLLVPAGVRPRARTDDQSEAGDEPTDCRPQHP